MSKLNENQNELVNLIVRDIKLFLDLIEEREGIDIGRELSFLEALKLTIYEISDFDVSVVVISLIDNFREHSSFDYLAIQNITETNLNERYEQYKKIRNKKEEENDERL